MCGRNRSNFKAVDLCAAFANVLTIAAACLVKVNGLFIYKAKTELNKVT